MTQITQIGHSFSPGSAIIDSLFPSALSAKSVAEDKNNKEWGQVLPFDISWSSSRLTVE
jgi:hypothetical protein